MSRRHDIQDATGVVVRHPTLGTLLVYLPSAPSDGDAGYGVGCEYHYTGGTAGTLMYVNIGTLSSASWLAIY